MVLTPGGEGCTCGLGQNAYVCPEGDQAAWCQNPLEGERGGCDNSSNNNITCKNALGLNTGALETWSKGFDTGLRCKPDLNCDYSQGKLVNYWEWAGDLVPGFVSEIDITNSLTTTEGMEHSNSSELTQQLRAGGKFYFGDKEIGQIEQTMSEKDVESVKNYISNALNHSKTWKVTEGSNLGGCGASVWQWALEATIEGHPECTIRVKPPAMDLNGYPIFDYPSKHTVITHSQQSPPCCVPGGARCNADGHNACFPDSPIMCEDFKVGARFHNQCNKACYQYNASTCNAQSLGDYATCVPTSNVPPMT
jgi:hypothetical protein